MTTPILKGTTALVTGASSGLGVDFAHELAGRGCNLILVARREERLRQVQAELTGRHNVDVTIIPMDLVGDDAPQQLYDQIRDQGLQVDVLVNNAGYGLYGPFAETPWEQEQNMLELDIVVVAGLTKLFLQDMTARNFGYILFVASIGAYLPSPLYASYSAAKSYVLSLGEALNYELRHSNVSCTVVSPGITRTEFHEVAGQSLTLYQRLVIMDSSKVVGIAIDAMLKGKPSVVAGWLNALTVFLLRFTPRRLAAMLAHRTMA